MTNLTISHTHENGTRLDGASKGDGVYEILEPLGWTYRPWAGVHIRGSRDRFARRRELERYAEALRAAGHTVTVDIDNTWRPAAIRWAEREERAETRADARDERAGNAAARSAAAHATARQVGDGIPLGQPILVGHHSESRARRDIARIDSAMRKSIDEQNKAKALASRAAGGRANEQAKHDPRAIMRKIETLETSIRRDKRELVGADPGSEWAEVTRLIIARDSEEVDYLRGILAEHADAGTFVAWSRDNIAKGDEVRAGNGWFRVTRVNTKTVSTDSGSWQRTVKWDDIHGRRRDGHQIDTPNGEAWPVAEARKVAQWARHLHSTNCRPHDDDARRYHANVAGAQRLVHGLPLTAADAELEAARRGERTIAEQRALAIRYLAVYDQLAEGVPAATIAASLTPDVDPDAWRLPDREPEDRRAGPLSGWRGDDGRQIQPGDLVKGYYDIGSGRPLIRSFCGPVAAVSEVRNRREAGDWVTITLVDGTAQELKTHMWLAVFPAGTWESECAEPTKETVPNL